MSGSASKPPKRKLPKKASRPARVRSRETTIPWLLIVALFFVYAISGLLLSAPTPPVWLWIPALVGTLLLVAGVHRPSLPGDKRDGLGLLAYLGALLTVVTLAIASNYVGAGEAFSDARFFSAVFLVAFLTSLAVILTAAATILTAQTSPALLTTMSYLSGLGVLVGTALLGLFIGGLIGYLAVGI